MKQPEPKLLTLVLSGPQLVPLVIFQIPFYPRLVGTPGLTGFHPPHLLDLYEV